jgi:hypothetical protein
MATGFGILLSTIGGGYDPWVTSVYLRDGESQCWNTFIPTVIGILVSLMF